MEAAHEDNNEPFSVYVGLWAGSRSDCAEFEIGASQPYEPVRPSMVFWHIRPEWRNKIPWICEAGLTHV